ncbi:MAG: hypothetical protein V3W31_05320 [Thermodesulfobacteriota bacterium]
MADFIDRAILIGTGLEKKLKELVKELEESGKGEEGEEGELPGGKKLENKVVDEGVKAVKDLLTVLREGKEKFEKELLCSTESLADKLNVATMSELDVVKEMARVAREKVDGLEKRVKTLEGKKKAK